MQTEAGPILKLLTADYHLYAYVIGLEAWELLPSCFEFVFEGLTLFYSLCLAKSKGEKCKEPA